MRSKGKDFGLLDHGSGSFMCDSRDAVFVFTIGVSSGYRIGHLECIRTKGSTLRGVETRGTEGRIESDRLN